MADGTYQTFETGFMGHLWEPGINVSSMMGETIDELPFPISDMADIQPIYKQLEEMIIQNLVLPFEIDNGRTTYREAYPDIKYRFKILDL